MNRIKWTHELNAKLIRLRESGMSCTAIGKEFGTTKNAIVGQLNRLGMIGNKAVTIENLKPDSCRWVTDDKHYCGQPQKAGSSYCEVHHARAHPKKIYGVVP